MENQLAQRQRDHVAYELSIFVNTYALQPSTTRLAPSPTKSNTNVSNAAKGIISSVPRIDFVFIGRPPHKTLTYAFPLCRPLQSSNTISDPIPGHIISSICRIPNKGDILPSCATPWRYFICAARSRPSPCLEWLVNAVRRWANNSHTKTP